MRHVLMVLYIILILIACDSPNNSISRGEHLMVKDPKLSELNSTNNEFSQAINKIKEYLTNLDVPIDSMYFVDVDSTSSDEWEFRIIHYDNYLIQSKYEVETKRIDSLEKIGVVEYYLNFMPPTGNWGGYDRTLFYSTINHEITKDVVDQ